MSKPNFQHIILTVINVSVSGYLRAFTYSWFKIWNSPTVKMRMDSRLQLEKRYMNINLHHNGCMFPTYQLL